MEESGSRAHNGVDSSLVSFPGLKKLSLKPVSFGLFWTLGRRVAYSS